jgi:hypothetical protein
MFMQRWNWVLSVDVNGRWITTQGYAEVMLSESKLQAALRYYTESGGIYHWLDGTLDEADDIDVVVRSPDPEVDAFPLRGTIFRGEPNEGISPMMILLTDGTTVMSLTYGSQSHEGNL